MSILRPRDPSRRPSRGRATWEVPAVPPGADPIDLEVCFTRNALQTLLDTVGSRPPESGAKLFGPVDGFGVDVVEFDMNGSLQAGGAVYAPDTQWGSERLDFWICQPGAQRRIWTGDAHSHPGDFGCPSQRAGPGLGDLGYVEAVFEQNEIQFEFCIPILTRTGGRQAVSVHPWVVLRSEPLRPRWANFCVRDAAGFPARRFNPAFEATASGRPTPTLRLDLDRLVYELQARCGRQVIVFAPDEGGAVEVDAGDAIVRIDLDPSGSTVTATILKGSGTGMHAGTTDDEATFDRESTAASLVAIALEAGQRMHRRTRSERPAAAPSDAVPPVAATLSDAEPHAEPHAEPPSTEAPVTESPVAVPSVGFTEDEYYARARSLLTDEFHRRSILVVGTSGGSYLIEKLARMGPRRLVLVDPDVVEVPNLVRTAFRIDQLGMPKPDAMAQLVASANPFVAVETWADDITLLTDDEVDRLLDGVDLIVAGTDSFDAQALMNRWSQAAGIPAVFIGVHEGAAGGIVRWSVPGETACYRCVAANRYEAAEAQDPALDLPGEPGLLIDVQAIDMVAASVIVGLLERGANTPKGRLIEQLGDRTQIVVSASPSYPWGQELFASLTTDLPAPASREEDLATYLGALPIITLPSEPIADCPDCARFAVDPATPTEAERPESAEPDPHPSSHDDHHHDQEGR